MFSLFFFFCKGGNNDNNHQKESRRPDKNFENRRYGTGRTASQYDNSERYNSKTEYFSDKYASDDRPSPSSSNHNRWSSNGHHQNSRSDNHYNSYQNNHQSNHHFSDRNENSDNGPKHGSRSQKEKRTGDYHGKKFDEFKANRNTKTANIKFDFTNCSQREKLIREIDAGKLECLVCCEMIKPYQSTWACPNCFHIIHLSCVIKWAASSKSEEGWRCCACQNINKVVPHEYFCFCGKLKNPQYNRSDVAHSCGESCGRSDGCEHRCTQLCHPGKLI